MPGTDAPTPEEMQTEIAFSRVAQNASKITMTHIFNAIFQANLAHGIANLVNIFQGFSEFYRQQRQNFTHEEKYGVLDMLLISATSMTLYYLMLRLGPELLKRSSGLLTGEEKDFYDFWVKDLLALEEPASSLSTTWNNAKNTIHKTDKFLYLIGLIGSFSQILLLYNVCILAIKLIQWAQGDLKPADIFYIYTAMGSFLALVFHGHFVSNPLIPGITTKSVILAWQSYGKKELARSLEKDLYKLNQTFDLLDYEVTAPPDQGFVATSFKFKDRYIRQGIKTTNINLLMKYVCFFLTETYGGYPSVNEPEKTITFLITKNSDRDVQALGKKMFARIWEYCFMFDEIMNQLERIWCTVHKAHKISNFNIMNSWVKNYHEQGDDFYYFSLILPLDASYPNYDDVISALSIALQQYENSTVEFDTISIKIEDEDNTASPLLIKQTLIKVVLQSGYKGKFQNLLDNVMRYINKQQTAATPLANRQKVAFTTKNSSDTASKHAPHRNNRKLLEQNREKPSPAKKIVLTADDVPTVTLLNNKKLYFDPAKLHMKELSKNVYGILLDDQGLLTAMQYSRLVSTLQKGIVTSTNSQGVVWDKPNHTFKIKLIGALGDIRILSYCTKGTDGRSLFYIFSSINLVVNYHTATKRHNLTATPDRTVISTGPS